MRNRILTLIVAPNNNLITDGAIRMDRFFGDLSKDAIAARIGRIFAPNRCPEKLQPRTKRQGQNGVPGAKMGSTTLRVPESSLTSVLTKPVVA